VEEAISCSERRNWRDTIKAEFQFLCANQVWDLVPPSKD